MNAAENLESLKQRLTQLGLYGLLAHWEEVATKPWLPELLGLEERERQRRSLERRLRTAKIGSIKPMSDFDWTWPPQDRPRGDRRALCARLRRGGPERDPVGPERCWKDPHPQEPCPPRSGAGPHREVHDGQRHAGRPRPARILAEPGTAAASLRASEAALHR